MLNQVDVRSKNDQLLSLLLQNPTNGIYIKDIEGLDPVKAVIVSSSFAGMDGEQYQASRREKRNILIKLGIDPDYGISSVRELRSYLYNFFMPKSEVRLRFFDTELPFVQIYGRVESFESAIFTKEPEASISLLCMNPDFYNPTNVVMNGSTVTDATEVAHNYQGTVDTGFIFQTTLVDPTASIEIHDRTPDNIDRVITLEYEFLAGDIVKVSTVPGSKYVYLTREGLESSILYAMDRTSPWIALEPGVNNIRVVAEGDPSSYTITYTNKFGGL